MHVHIKYVQSIQREMGIGTEFQDFSFRFGCDFVFWQDQSIVDKNLFSRNGFLSQKTL